jgi:hypothetical protein
VSETETISVPNWNRIHSTMNVQFLLLAIIKTHSEVSTGLSGRDKVVALRNYLDNWPDHSVNPVSFHAQWEDNYKHFTTFVLPKFELDEDAQAYDFCNKLASVPKFAPWHQHLLQQNAYQPGFYPTTVAAALCSNLSTH